MDAVNRPKLGSSRTALVDGDIVAYKAAVLTEANGGDELDAEELTHGVLRDWVDRSTCKRIIVCLSKGRGYRYDAWPEYKANRKAKPSPEYRSFCIDVLCKSYKTAAVDGLEADDVIGIAATNGKVENPVIVSIDKDLEQIPGWHFNPGKDEFPVRKTVEEADYCFYTQWLTGDSSDGYAGIPGCGPVKAKKILEDGMVTGDACVAFAYYQARQSYDYYLAMSRLAKILRAENWDADARKPLLYQPTVEEKDYEELAISLVS